MRVEQTDGGFGLGQLSSDQDDIQVAKANTRYRFSEEVVLSASASHQEVLSSDNERNVADTRF